MSKQHALTVVKIGGSTLGANDTTIEDVVELRRRGERVVIVHGGGAMITEWLDRLGVTSTFVEGLRSTTAEALQVVIAVLRGVVNTQLVAAIERSGGRAFGLSGVDGGMIRARVRDERLGFVGDVTDIDREAIRPVLESGAVPVIAPIGFEPPGQPLNINADTVAGEVARALGAQRLVFLTDVDGVLNGDGEVIERLDADGVAALRQEGTLAGGMIPKIDACLRAASGGTTSYIANGRLPRTLDRIVAGEALGTRIGE